MSGVIVVSKLYNNVLCNKMHLTHLFTKKRELIKVKHGFFIYNVNIKNVSCTCSSSLCCHLMYIFVHLFGIDLKYMLSFDRNKDVYFEVLHKYISRSIDGKTVGLLLNTHIEAEIHDLECVMCMSKIQNVFTSFQCPLCKKFTHTKCQNKWFVTRKTCVHCMQDVKDM